MQEQIETTKQIIADLGDETVDNKSQRDPLIATQKVLEDQQQALDILYKQVGTVESSELFPKANLVNVLFALLLKNLPVDYYSEHIGKAVQMMCEMQDFLKNNYPGRLIMTKCKSF